MPLGFVALVSENPWNIFLGRENHVSVSLAEELSPADSVGFVGVHISNAKVRDSIIAEKIILLFWNPLDGNLHPLGQE